MSSVRPGFHELALVLGTLLWPDFPARLTDTDRVKLVSINVGCVVQMFAFEVITREPL